jgi:hypothetical protein
MNKIYILIPTTSERRPRLKECLDSLEKYAGMEYEVKTIEDDERDCIAKGIELLKSVPRESLVWILNDDQKLIEPDTLKRLYEIFNREFPNGDGVVQPFESIQGAQLSVAPFGKAITFLKYSWPEYIHYFIDTEMTAVLKKKGLYYAALEVVIEHNHHINGKAPKDNTYENSERHWDHDEEIYLRRRSNNFLPENEDY